MNNITVTENEVFSIAFNRNLSLGLIKPTQINVAEDMWVKAWLGDEFYNNLTDDQTKDDYYEFVESYIKPIIAWGTLYNNYDYLTQNITDKGILQMFVENAATVVDRDSRFDAKMEIKRTVYRLIKMMQNHGYVKRVQGDSLFNDFETTKLSPSIIRFHGNERSYLKPY